MARDKKTRLQIIGALGNKGYTPGEALAGTNLIEDMYTTTGKQKKGGKLAVAERKTEQQEPGEKTKQPPPKKRQWQLSTAVFPDGAGTITPHGKGPQYYNDGDEVTIQFTPNPGTNFLHFMVNGNIFNASRVVRQANRFLSPLSQQQQGDRYIYILDVVMTMNLSIQAICDGEPRSNAPTINVTPTINTGPTNVKVKVKGGAGGGGNTFNLTCQIHPSTDGGTISGFENGGTRHYPAGSIAHVTTL
ncbi:hypothetical protein HZA98_01290, partial [Candidatus Woesearchaeota archaeon]|nr:hypothetical protein [Candidatus Woesearchaeota archaeon]